MLVAIAVCLVIASKLTVAMPAIKAILVAPLGTFFYPLEIEWREGSFWLDALALRERPLSIPLDIKALGRSLKSL